MKKLLALCLALCCLFSLAACTVPDSGSYDSDYDSDYDYDYDSDSVIEGV